MTAGGRELRADARRNRERLLDAAGEVFARDGLEAPIDAIARTAGIGPGTVYRHFPTKQALFEAVMSHQIGKLVERAHELAVEAEPLDAFESFLGEMIAASRRQRGLFDAVGAPPAAHDSAPSYAKAMLDALGELLAAAQRAGAVRTEVTVHDVKALIAGVKSAEELGGEPDRLLTVVTRGLRT